LVLDPVFAKVGLAASEMIVVKDVESDIFDASLECSILV
jgi:hypothetical protein